MRKTLVALSLAAASIVSMPGAALAHTRLVSSSPAANTTVARVPSIRLTFNERVIASTVKTELLMTGMPGMRDHAPMKIAFRSALASDGKSMTLTPRTPLTPGTYKVTWSAAGADTHRMGSEFSFTVK
jgi:methionine-rich copper-binding protein CopC